MDLSNKIQELQEKRQKNLNKMNDMVSSAKAANAKVDETQWNTYLEEDRSLEKEISQNEFLLKRNKEAAAKEIAAKETEERGGNKEDKGKEYREVFNKYIRHGASQLSSEERTLLAEHRGTGNQTTAATGGGYTIPEGFSNQLFEEMAHWGGVREAATVITTQTGNLIPWPTEDDTSTTGHLLTEGTTDTVKDVTFASKDLNAYTYSSGTVKVSVQLLQDTFMNMQEFLNRKFARRLGTITNLHYTTGDGSSKPNGFITAGTSGVTAASATAITRGELVDLVHSVNRAYRKGGKVGFMFNDQTLGIIKKLSIGSADDRPLWQPSIVQGEPDTLEGFQYWINDDMANIATTAKAIAFGDFSQYIIRDALGVTAVRLNERYMDNLLVGFMAYLRTDGELLSSNAIKFITQG